MLRLRLVAVVCLVGVLVAGCNRTDLAFRPTKGQTKSYEIKTEVNSSTKSGAADMTQSQNGHFDLTFEVMDVDPGGVATLKATYGKAHFDTKLGSGGQTMD